jgi:putative transposase
MTDERAARHRRSIRLKGYDYAAAGAYFVTIAAQGRECLFGQVVDGEMRLNEAGRMVEGQWLALADRFPTVDLDEFVVMPNHFHGIILLEPLARAVDSGPLDRAGTSPAPTECTAVGATLVVARNGTARNVVARSDGVRAGTSPAPTANATDRAPSLGAVVGAFKSISTQAYMDGVRQSGWPPFVGRLWQRNYFEHIIRGERSLDRIREYVAGNPQRWAEDRENPSEVDKPTCLGRLPQPWEA